MELILLGHLEGEHSALHRALSAVTKAFLYPSSNVGVRTYLHEILH